MLAIPPLYSTVPALVLPPVSTRAAHPLEFFKAVHHGLHLGNVDALTGIRSRALKCCAPTETPVGKRTGGDRTATADDTPAGTSASTGRGRRAARGSTRKASRASTRAPPRGEALKPVPTGCTSIVVPSPDDGSELALAKYICPSIRTSPGPHGSLLLGFTESDGFARSSSSRVLGKLNADRYFACSRIKRWWMGPLVCNNARRVPVETQFLLTRLQANAGTTPVYAVIIPLIEGAHRSTLCGNPLTNELLLRTDSGDRDVRTASVHSAAVVVADADPYVAVSRAFEAAAEEMGTFRTRAHKQEPSHLDVFGWCTWDAFYSAVEPRGVLEGVRSLKSGGAPPKFVIIDDGWQSVDAGERNRQGRAFADFREKPKDDMPDSSPLNAAARFLSFVYTAWVEPAPFSSPRSKLWQWLSKGPLRSKLIQFFDENTDFSKSLVSFRANVKFEHEGESLKTLVDELKHELDVRSIYVWHALSGYWSGVSPCSEEMAAFESEWSFPQPTSDLLMVEPAVAWDAASFHGVGAVKPEKLDDFYNGMHSYLEKSGIDGVKVDAQSGMGPFGAGFGIGAPAYVSRAVHAMENSVRSHLSRSASGAAECINCMCHSTENLFSYYDTAVVRAGDDFYPRDVASHAAHITTVAYNSVFIGELGAVDWDMFQSSHPSAALHAAARAVGGGAIYVSDKPGEHDFNLLRQLVLPDGRTFRARHAGRPTLDCLFEDVSNDGETALKIWNAHAHTGVIGGFNVQGSKWSRQLRRFVSMPDPRMVELTLSPRDIAEPRFQGQSHSDDHPDDHGNVPTDAPTKEYAIYDFREKSVSAPLAADGTLTAAPLGGSEWNLFFVAPVHVAADGGAKWAALGLLDMMNGGGAVLELDNAQPQHARVVATGAGNFGFYASCEPDFVKVNGDIEPFDYDAFTGLLSVLLHSSSEDELQINYNIEIGW